MHSGVVLMNFKVFEMWSNIVLHVSVQEKIILIKTKTKEKIENIIIQMP